MEEWMTYVQVLVGLFVITLSGLLFLLNKLKKCQQQLSQAKHACAEPAQRAVQLEEENRSLTTQLELHVPRTTLDELENTLQAKDNEIQNLRQQIQQQKEHAKQQQDTVSNHLKEIQDLTERINLQQQKLDKIHEEFDAIQQQLSCSVPMDQLDALHKQNALKDEQLESMKASSELLSDKVKELEQKNNEWEEKHNLIVTQNFEAVEKLQGEMKLLLVEKETQSDSFSGECETLKLYVKQLEEQLKEDADQYKSKMEEMVKKFQIESSESETSRLSEFNQKEVEWKEKLEAIETEKSDLLEKFQNESSVLRQEIDNYQKRVSELSQANESLSKIVEDFEIRFTKVESSLQEYVSLDSSQVNIEDLIRSLTENLHNTQNEMKKLQENSEHVQQRLVEEIKEKEEKKKVEFESKDQLYSEILQQYEMEKKCHQEVKEKLKVAEGTIKQLNDALLFATKGIVSEEEKEEEELSPEDLAKRERLLKQRSNVLKEIYQTEKNYVAILEMVHSEFIIPLKQAINDGEPILTDAELRVIFPSWEVIKNYNTLFLSQLKERIDTWEDTQCVGDLFIEICLWLKSYSSYINSFDAAAQALAEANKQSAFKAFLNTPRSKKALKRQDLTSFLITPVQRLPRYVLLLKEMVKCTPKDHADYNALQKALEGVTKIADTVNASKLQNESREMMFRAGSRFGSPTSGLIIAPHRTFVAEGIFFKNPALVEMDVENISLKEIHILLLFSDIIVHARPNDCYNLEDYLNHSKSGAITPRGPARKKSQEPVKEDLELKKIYKVSAYELVPAEKNNLGLKLVGKGGSPLKIFGRNEEEVVDWLLLYESTRKGIPGIGERRKKRGLFTK